MRTIFKDLQDYYSGLQCDGECDRAGSGDGAGAGAGAEVDDESERIRGAMWALGHIGACDMGYGLLHQCAAMLTPRPGAEITLLFMLSELALSAPNFSVRGTAFCVIGLMSQSCCARSELDALGWGVSTLGLSSSSSPVAVPHDISRLFQPTPTVVASGAAAAGSASSSPPSAMPQVSQIPVHPEEAIFRCARSAKQAAYRRWMITNTHNAPLAPSLLSPLSLLLSLLSLVVPF